MSYRRNATGLLGLLAVVVLGAMAFASSAQAVLPVFLINKKLALHATATGVTHEGLEVLLIPGLNVEIKCPEFETLEGLILDSKIAHAIHVRLLYKNCKVFTISPKLEETTCHVSDVAGGKPELLHITASFLLLPVEFLDGTFGLLLENLVTTINFLKETGCALPLKNVITGEVCFKILENDTVKPLIESDQKIQEECPEKELVVGKGLKKDLLAFGINDAFLDAKALLSLTGEHKGLTLGVSLD